MNTKKRNNLKPKAHIIFQRGDEWVVKGKTKLRVSAKANSMNDAIHLGRVISKHQGTKLYICKGKKLVRIKPDVVSEKKMSYRCPNFILEYIAQNCS